MEAVRTTSVEEILSPADHAAGRTGVAVVCGYAAPVDFAQSERDLWLFRAYRAHLGPTLLVVRSPDGANHLWQEDDLTVRYVRRGGHGVLGLLPFWIRSVLSTWRFVRRYGVRVGEASDLAGAFVLIPLKWLAGVPMLLHIQWPFFEMSPLAFPRWKRWAFRTGVLIACHFATSIRCVTEDIRQQAIRAGITSDKLVVIPSRCDATVFDPTRVRTRSAGTGQRLIYVGALAKHKGLDVLLEAMLQILHHAPGAKLLVAGDGPQRKALQDQAARAGVAAAVEFVGNQPYSALPELLGSADLFVYPSFSEAMPRAILEAMAMQRPVVVTGVGGNPEAVRDGIEGLVVPPGNPQALAAAVCRVLADSTLAQAFGRRGRQRVLDCFSFEQNLHALVAWHRASISNGVGR